MNIEFRLYQATDLDFFKSMFYESLFVPPGDAPFPKTIIEKPHLARYYTGWGREGDLCHVVEIMNNPIGAIWTRHFIADDPGYGFVAEDVPELGIAIKPEWTGKEIGTRMMSFQLDMLKNQGIEKVSLSVDVRNRAFELYKRLGFEVVGQEGYSAVMMKII